jgi:magnesium transporter
MNRLPGIVPNAVSTALRRTAVTAKLARRRLRRPANLHVAPGTITVAPDALPTEITVIAYSTDRVEERRLGSLAELDAASAGASTVWINVDGLADADALRAIADRFGIHPLAMEDATDASQRAKVDTYGDAVFVVLPMPHDDGRGFWTEQISMWVTPTHLITFQGIPGDCLDPLRQRIRNPAGRVRHRGTSYLAYAIADAVIDAYFPVVDRVGGLVEDLEEEVFRRPTGRQLAQIRLARGELIRMRRALLPIRDTASAMMSLDRVFDAEVRPYLRDLADHVARALDQIETDRYMANDLLEIYMTSVNMKLGETSKVLTIIATIFMPLSFITGLWGMNFAELPLATRDNGFWLALGLMAATTVGFFVYFWRKGWLKDTTKP